jgi:DeoR/GlpR family transcriptional regulator of sugar metabolism
MMNNYALKRELAEFAASLVNNGETVFIENGSSNALLRARLPIAATLPSSPSAAISRICLKRRAER